jgi:hypothetical protein
MGNRDAEDTHQIVVQCASNCCYAAQRRNDSDERGAAAALAVLCWRRIGIRHGAGTIFAETSLERNNRNQTIERAGGRCTGFIDPVLKGFCREFHRCICEMAVDDQCGSSGTISPRLITVTQPKQRSCVASGSHASFPNLIGCGITKIVLLLLFIVSSSTGKRPPEHVVNGISILPN